MVETEIIGVGAAIATPTLGLLGALARWALHARDEARETRRLITYHLEPNGAETPEERRTNRPLRSMVIESDKAIQTINERQANDHRWQHRHELDHARLGLEPLREDEQEEETR